MNIFGHMARPTPLLGPIISVGAAALLAILVVLTGFATEKGLADTQQAMAVSGEKAKLIVKPRTIELVSEKAMRLRNAIKQDDFSTADQITADVLANSRLQNWRFYPFSNFVSGVSDLSDPEFETHLDRWVAKNMSDATPLLVRAKYYFDMGWFKRGSRFSEHTQAVDLVAFEGDIKKASADIDASIHLNDQNPYSFYLRLKILQDHGVSDEMKAAFEEAVQKYPGYYPLYDVVLETLEPKWSGSVATMAAMYAFVDRYAGKAVEFSPLKLLYLSLYRVLLNTAYVDCYSLRRDRDKMDECVTSAMQKRVTPELETRVQQAFQLYEHSDAYQFGAAVSDILSPMLNTPGGDAYAGMMLQLAATSMHSDVQLKEDTPRHDNYVINEAVAQSWYRKGFYDNALEKHRQALKDIEDVAFPTEEEKDLNIAGIYKFMGEAYERLGQYADMIAYEQAAIELGGKTGDEHFICFGYYRLKDYDEAVRTCTKAIDDTGNMKARYWRGVAYRDSGQTDAALRDLTTVADSEDDLRTTAAINLSMIYFDRHDDRSSLNCKNADFSVGVHAESLAGRSA
jgi:tetratricopeptide (TPR) repeat protein